MQEYVLCICFSILFCAGVSLLVPSDKYKGIVNIVCGVYILSTMLTPLKGIINTDFNIDSISSFFETDGRFSESVTQSTESMNKVITNNSLSVMEAQLKRELESTYNAQIDLVYEENGLKAYVTADDEYKEQIKNYVEKTYSIEIVFK